jgi:hypothetical protein
MKKQIIFLLFIICVRSLSAQTVIGTAGSVVQNNAGSVSYTIGESIVANVSNSSKILTQGFQQPKLKIVTLANELENSGDFIVYPNPTTTKVFFKNVEKIKSVSVISVTGQLLFTEKNISEGIDFQHLPNEIYMLQILTKEDKIIFRKVIKIR